ncbi:MAG: CoA transferase [Gammaproteobacteria bacterium]|nr:CoA transferase [Gammaproteobacteria bacterium]
MPNVQSLKGLSVLEFSHTVMGPCAGLLLAELGADVIKIEPAPSGDRTRQLTGFASGFFATFNRNKRSLAVNLKTVAGQKIIHRLIEDADVVIENYGPGTMEKLNCGWNTLRLLNDRLIYLSLKGYLKGPFENKPALDEVVQFQSGLAYMTGPVGQPLRAGASIVDILGAVFGIVGVQAALRERDLTGEGQRVGSALFESAAFMMASHIAGGAALNEIVPPMTARKGAWGIYDVFLSEDNQQLFIGVTSDSQWLNFCSVFQFDDLLTDDSLRTNALRCDSRDWLLPEISKRLAQISYEVLHHKCESAGVSWSPVVQPEQLLQNAHLLSDGGLVDTSLETALNSVAPSTWLPALPLEFGDERVRPDLSSQPPTLGEHTDDILSSIGYSKKDITCLKADLTVIG